MGPKKVLSQKKFRVQKQLWVLNLFGYNKTFGLRNPPNSSIKEPTQNLIVAHRHCLLIVLFLSKIVLDQKFVLTKKGCDPK